MHYRQHTVLSHQVPQYVEILLCSRGMTLFHWGGGGGGGVCTYIRNTKREHVLSRSIMYALRNYLLA